MPPCRKAPPPRRSPWSRPWSCWRPRRPAARARAARPLAAREQLRPRPAPPRLAPLPRPETPKSSQRHIRSQTSGEKAPRHHQDRSPAGQCRTGDQGGRQLSTPAHRPLRPLLAAGLLALLAGGCSGSPFGAPWQAASPVPATPIQPGQGLPPRPPALPAPAGHTGADHSCAGRPDKAGQGKTAPPTPGPARTDPSRRPLLPTRRPLPAEPQPASRQGTRKCAFHPGPLPCHDPACPRPIPPLRPRP